MKFKRIHIELTNRCNFACEFCPDSLMTRERGDMKLQLLDNILEQIRKAQLTKTILFHVMGEPLLYPHLIEAVRHAKEKGFKVCLTTNGWLLTEGVFQSLIKSKIDQIIFSVQTPNAESFKLRKAKIDFNKYKDKITLYAAKALTNNMDTKITLSFLTTPLKTILLPSKKMSIINTQKELQIYLISWVKATLSKGTGKEVAGINSQLGKIEKEIKKWNLFGWNLLKITDTFMLETRLLGDWIHPGLSLSKINRAVIGSCEGLTEHFGILWNGDLVFCCVDFDGKTVFGNVKNIKIVEALQKKETNKIINGFRRLRILHPYCQRCLGDASLKKSLARQVGSILYFKFYRPWWDRKRKVTI